MLTTRVSRTPSSKSLLDHYVFIPQMSLAGLSDTAAQLWQSFHNIAKDALLDMQRIRPQRAQRACGQTQQNLQLVIAKDYLPNAPATTDVPALCGATQSKRFRLQEYHNAVSHKFRPLDLANFRSSTLIRPLFLYDHMMLPATIRHALLHNRRDPLPTFRGRMGRAALKHHRLYHNEHADLPAALPSDDPEDVVHGMLVYATNAEKDAIQDFIVGGSQENNALYRLEAGKVEFLDIDGALCTEDVGFYVWSGGADELIEAKEKAWDPEKFMDSDFYLDMPQPWHK